MPSGNPIPGEIWSHVQEQREVMVTRVWDNDRGGRSVSLEWETKGSKSWTAMPIWVFLHNYAIVQDEPQRLSAYEYFMSMARTAAERSTCPRLKVGAVLVRDGVQFGQGYNGKARNEPHCAHDLDTPCADSVHAEVNAIISAARLGNRVQGSYIYVTHAPCLNCARIIINAGLNAVYFGKYYRDTAGVELLNENGLIL